jgi:hypothetical protein
MFLEHLVYPTLAKILRATKLNRLPSIKLLVSNANEDMVVNDPQNPTATSKEYFASRFKAKAATENTPKTKLPSTLTIKTLTCKPPNVTATQQVDTAKALLLQRQLPREPLQLTAFFCPPYFSPLGRHYQQPLLGAVLTAMQSGLMP